MPHHLPHIYMDDTWYMITARTVEGRRLFSTQGYKELIREKIKVQ